MASDTRQRLVDAAKERFYSDGFRNVGIDAVLTDVGISKAAFYKHFESKDDLMVAAVKQKDEWESQAWGRAVQKLAGDDPAGQLLAMFDVMDLWFNDPDFLGCMFMNTAAEFPNPHDPVHQAAAAHKRRMRDGWRDLARQAGATDASAEAFADLFATLVEGTLVMRQVHGRDDAARVSRPLAAALLGQYIPSST